MARVNLKDWIASQHDRHICQCGCGGTIIVLRHHHARGIPRFINGHSSRVENGMRGRSNESNPNFKRGHYTTPRGYVAILNPERTCKADKYIYEHRYVMEKHLGRKLRSDEQVHHRNGIKTDNRVENLHLLSVSEHAALHQEELRRAIGEKQYLLAKRCIGRGLPYRDLLACSV